MSWPREAFRAAPSKINSPLTPGISRWLPKRDALAGDLIASETSTIYARKGRNGVVKQIGCRMDHDGYPVPSDFAPFLDGGAMLPSVQMVMFKDPALWALHGKFRGEWDGTLILGSDPAWGEVSPSLGTIKVYASSLSIGYVGISYRWDMDVPNIDPFYLHRKVRLHRRG